MTIYTVKVDDTGTKLWYLDDKLHRTDAPAVEWADGSKHWYQNNKLHRVDGPAYEDASGTKCWWLDGKELTESQWIEAVKPKVASCVGKMVEVDGVKYKLVAA